MSPPPGLAEEQTIEGLVGRVRELERTNRELRSALEALEGNHELTGLIKCVRELQRNFKISTDTLIKCAECLERISFCPVCKDINKQVVDDFYASLPEEFRRKQGGG